MSKRKTQSGFASFTMNDLAELVTIVNAKDWLTKPIQDDKKRMDVDEPIKPKQNELQNTRTSREVR
tara:strand:+ start:263 stop:460 length:198 start_codon:yes stop_codon:yes gene_type:complete